MMHWLTLLLAIVVVRVDAADGAKPTPSATALCTDAWYRTIEKSISTGDGQGHGPDIGSDEWKSVVEFKLGIRGKPDVPNRDSEAWCRHVDRIVRGSAPRGAGAVTEIPATKPTGPSYDCGKVRSGSIEALICADAELSALDRTLARAYAAASKKAANERPPVLKSEQRGWIKGRDECWKSADKRECVREAYRVRTAELQARYRLVPGNGPVLFVCDGDPRSVVVATFFATDPPTLIAERGDSVSFMVAQRSASGTRYAGRNESLWEHQGGATITWGYGTPPMRCRKAA
jgi:uncharacterized protein